MRLGLIVALVSIASSLFGEDIFRERFEAVTKAPPLRHSWGDKPAKIIADKVLPGIGVRGSSAVQLKLLYPPKVKHNLSYWSYDVAKRVPLSPQLQNISFRVKTNVPVSIKIALWPFGFIYHGPRVGASPKWQTVTLPKAYDALKRWCERGKRQAEDGWIASVIVAVADKANCQADIVIDDIAFEGPAGARQAMAREAFVRRVRQVRVAAISLVWDQGNRTLANTLEALDEAGLLGADLACLPQECVFTAAEPIPGPTSHAIAQKAAQYGMYVVGNLREEDGDKVYVTSFLCDRKGKIVGKYRKSHKLPYETNIALGRDLPVFATDFGAIGLMVGTDYYFPEIDRVMLYRGARLVVWSTAPFPLRDEHMITLTVRGRSAQNRQFHVVARYAGKQGYGGYKDRFSWTGSWPIGRAQVFDPSGHTIADSGHKGGVAIASIPRARLGGSPHDGGYPTEGKFALITAAKLPVPFKRTPKTKRVIRAAVIECEGNLDRLHAKLDECGKQGCDIACLWEYVWYHNDEQVVEFRDRNRQRLARLADSAKRNNMYIVIGGELERGFNESIIFDRQGRELGRYTKINQTTAKTSKYYQAGQRVGVFDLDFGRICTKICADVGAHEIDRVAGLQQVDLLLLHTQDAGPYSEAIRLREAVRCLDNGYFLLRAAGGGTERDHRSYIMDPWAMVLAGSQFGVNNPPLVSRIDLDNRPKYYEWPEAVRKAGVYPDPVKRGIPADARLKMYGRFNRPVAKGDLRAVVLSCRRPELYRARDGKNK